VNLPAPSAASLPTPPLFVQSLSPALCAPSESTTVEVTTPPTPSTAVTGATPTSATTAYPWSPYHPSLEPPPISEDAPLSPFVLLAGKSLIDAPADIQPINFQGPRSEVLTTLLPTLRTHVLNLKTLSRVFDHPPDSRRRAVNHPVARALKEALAQPNVSLAQVKYAILATGLNPVRVLQLVASSTMAIIHGPYITTPAQMRKFLINASTSFPYAALSDFRHGIFETLCSRGPWCCIPRIDRLWHLGQPYPDFTDFCAALLTMDIPQFFQCSSDTGPRWLHPPGPPYLTFWDAPPDSSSKKAKSSAPQPASASANTSSTASKPVDTSARNEPKSSDVPSYQTNNAFRDLSKCLTVPLTFPDMTQLDAIIDPGADISLISEDFAHLVGGPITIDWSQPIVSNTSPLQQDPSYFSHRVSKLRFTLPHTNDTIYSQRFDVVPKPHVLLLGLDFWRQHPDLLLDLLRKKLLVSSTDPSPDQAQIDAAKERALMQYHDAPLALPPRRDSDYRLELTTDKPHWHSRPTRSLSAQDTAFMREEVNKLLAVDFIVSVSPTSLYSVPFITRHGAKPRMVLDYR